MTRIESSVTTHGFDSLISVEGYDADEIFATTANDKKELTERWNAIVDQPLIEWGQNPSFTDEDGLVSPSKESCASAVKLVAYLRTQGGSLPTGVVSDGEGGIAFENKQGPSYQRFDVDEAGHIALFVFHDCKLHSQYNFE